MKEITVEELEALLKVQPNLKVLDVREEDEYEEYNLNTQLLPLSKIKNMEIDEIAEWKNLEFVVFCKGGARSLEACLFLKTYGFSNPVFLKGGISAWLSVFEDKKLRN